MTPKPWPVSSLGELKAFSLYGPRFSSDAYADDGVAVLRTSDISEGGKVNWDRAPRLPLSPAELAKYRALRGDILVTRTGSLGTVAVFDDELDAVPGAYLIQYRLKQPGVTSWWVYYFLRSPAGQRALVGGGAGVGRPNLNAPTIDAIPIPVPDVEEQGKTIAEIERHSSRIDVGVAALKRVHANLKRYRASVLKAACEGHLVPTEAELARRESRDYEPASVLLQRILKERRHHWEASELAKLKAKGKHPTDDRWKARYEEPAAVDIAGLPDLQAGWCWARVAQLGQSVTGTTPKTNEPANFDGTLPFFKPTDLDQGYNVRDARDHLTAVGSSGARVLPPRSVLVTCIGATIGKTGLARVACATNQQINALVLTADETLPEYAFWFFCSPLGQNSILAASSATTLPILNKSRFDELVVPLPPLHEQRRIVAEVERLVTRLESLQTAVGTNRVRANRLCQSVLKAAFEGKLAPPASAAAAGVEPAAPVIAQRHKGRKTVELADV